MLEAGWNETNWRSPVITTDWKWLIRLAWGKRELSTAVAVDGMNAYPRVVGAGLMLWLSWLKESTLTQTPTIVISANPIPKKPYVWLPPTIDAQPVQKPYLAPEHVSILRHERQVSRQFGDYEASDAIRDFLTYHNVVEADQKTHSENRAA